MNRTRRVDDIYEAVRPIEDAGAFQQVINAEEEDYVLADLRDRFWNGQGDKPWQVKEINRLLTRRRENRAASDTSSKATSLKERVENNAIMFFLGALLTGFLAGLGTFEGALKLIDYSPTSNDYLRKLKEDLDSKKDVQKAEQRWLRIRGVDGLDGIRARLVARVNGTAYSYPSRVVWAELGRGMVPEDFPLTVGTENYDLSFELLTLSTDNQYRQFQSQQVISVRTWPFEGEYKVFPVSVDKSGPSRAADRPTNNGPVRRVTGGQSSDVARILFEVR